jgi:hypothetical protein
MRRRSLKSLPKKGCSPRKRSLSLRPTALLAPLVEIPLPEEHAAKLAPEELRRRQLTALIAWYLAGARTQPAVLAASTRRPPA